jgi:putative oxidoreductase
VIEVGGAILLIVGWKTRWAAWLLALFTVIATFAAHRFWEFEPAQQVGQMNNFLKNLAIIGGLLFLAAAGPGRMSADRA